ncbi:CLUMA_CG008449, isoform A [Clunio marinus]|uniref:CLUMA_CG008449, isoform A n=1 Tax=Clunio marinus TaxID=568069 RepID=A0A1J1I955_9DIPT|nr:CLUMA_CG008449, isoform A [Clunio marinus]
MSNICIDDYELIIHNLPTSGGMFKNDKLIFIFTLFKSELSFIVDKFNYHHVTALCKLQERSSVECWRGSYSM